MSSSESSGDLIGAAIRDNEVLIQFGNSVDNADTNEPTSSPNKLIERPLEEGVWADDSFAQFFGGGGGGGGEGQFGNPGPVATDGSQRNLMERRLEVHLCTQILSEKTELHNIRGSHNACA